MHQLPPLNWVRSFEAAARRESFTAAAHELGRTPAAISHHVRSLEDQLGFRLFERLGHGLRLTDMGRAYLPSVRKAFEDLSLSTAGLFGLSGARPITVRTTISFAILWLAPRLLDFRERYPEIDVHLYSAVWADALSPDDLDMEIRLGEGNWPGYHAELLRAERAVPVCSHETHAALGPYACAADLQGRELIHVTGFESLWMRFFRQAGLETAVSTRGITVDTMLAAIELVAAGRGHAMLLDSFARAPAVAPRLTRLKEDGIPLDRGHYLLLPERSDRTRSEVLLFREWLFEAAGQSSGAQVSHPVDRAGGDTVA